MSGEAHAETFVMVESFDVWCQCGRIYSATDGGLKTCPQCGRQVEITWSFRVVEPAAPAPAPEATNG